MSSFILAGLGLSLGLLPTKGMSLVLAGMISIALNPFLFAAIEPFRRWVLKRSDLARRLERRKRPAQAAIRNANISKGKSCWSVTAGEHALPKAWTFIGSPLWSLSRTESWEGLRKRMVAVSGDASEPSVLIRRTSLKRRCS